MSADPFERLAGLAAQVKTARGKAEEERKAEANRHAEERQGLCNRAALLAYRVEAFLADVRHAADGVIHMEASADGARLVVNIGTTTVIGEQVGAKWVINGEPFDSDLAVCEHLAGAAAEVLRRELDPKERFPCPHCGRELDSIGRRAQHVRNAHPGEYPYINPFDNSGPFGRINNDLAPWIAAVEETCASK